MNRFMVLFSAALLAVAIVGCDKKSTPEEPKTSYDSSVDAPPSNLNVALDNQILRDQREVSRQYSTPAPAPAKTPAGDGSTETPASAPATETPAATPPDTAGAGAPATPSGTATPPAAGDAIDAATTSAVKAAYAKVVEAANTGGEQQLQACFVQSAWMDFGKVVDVQNSNKPKIQEFEGVAKDKLQIQTMPDAVQKFLAVAKHNLLETFAKVNSANVKIRKVGESFVVGTDKTNELSFVKDGEEWKVTLSDNERKALQAEFTASESVSKVLDGAIKGMIDDSINAANLEERMKGLIKQHMGDAVKL